MAFFMKFIDEVRIKVSSGHGGQGCVSFRRESMTPRGGPDGGDGGRGGDVIFKVQQHLNSLVDFRNSRHYSAQNGQQGSGDNCSGSAGKDLVIEVPVGTVVRDSDGQVILDLTEVSETQFLKGGRGGKGNHFFKSSVNQAPEFAQPGEPGESKEIFLELKLIADVGIIGFPNAGKSTLISRISAARPKIADYPFTTLTPNLGVVKAHDYKSFVVADIPGLIKGAHLGAGLGIQFLKHIERTQIFVHMIDVSSGEGKEIIQSYEDIQHELKMYDQMNQEKEGFFPLCPRPQIVVFNKIDTVQSEPLERIAQDFKKKTGVKPLLLSAVSGKNLPELIQSISNVVFAGDEANEKKS